MPGSPEAVVHGDPATASGSTPRRQHLPRAQGAATASRRCGAAAEKVLPSSILLLGWRSRGTCLRRRRLVSETARPVPKATVLRGNWHESTHSRDRNSLPAPRSAPSSRRRPPRARVARPAAARAHAPRRVLAADRAGTGRRTLRVPVRADRLERTQRVDRRPGEPADGKRAVGREVGVGGARLRAARLARRRAAGRGQVRDDPEPHPAGGATRTRSGPIPTRRSAARCSSPTTGRSTPSTRRSSTLLGTLPPLRATLLGPVDRNEIYSASARYSRALADEILPALPSAPVRIGLGASLGALALFHAHRRYPDSFDALFLQSGSFFRRAESYERMLPALRADRALRRRRPSQPARARDPGRARLRNGRGEPPREPGARGVARAGAATTSACTSSATGTTGSPGATPSTRTCVSCSRE